MSNIKQINKSNPQNQDLIFPIQVKQMTDEETKEYHLKRLFELSKIERSKLDFKVDGTVWKGGKPIAEELDYDQKKWLHLRLTHPNTWPKAYKNIGDVKNWK